MEKWLIPGTGQKNYKVGRDVLLRQDAQKSSRTVADIVRDTRATFMELLVVKSEKTEHQNTSGDQL